MNSQKNVLLSAGLLFLLIDEVKLDKRAQEYYLAGNSDPQAKPIVLSDLIFVFTEHRYTIPDPECSKFITCGSNGSKNIPFNKQSYADTFDDIINNHYSVALDRMKGFIDCHIDRSREKWLVKALVDVMERDDSIGDETILFINENGSSVQKKALDSIDDYCLDSLVLGVLHYIVVHRNGMNKQGATAFKENSCKENNEHKYNGSFGSSLGKRIKTHPLDEKYTASEAKDDYEAEIVTEIESTVSDDEATMADDVFEGASYADPTSNGVPQPNITYIQNQTNIGKSESRTYNIDNSVTLNVNTSSHRKANDAEMMMAIQSFSHKYYQLLVTTDKEIFKDKVISFPVSRALVKGTVPPEIFDRCSSLEEEGIRELKTFPALVCIENRELDGKTSPDEVGFLCYIRKIQPGGRTIRIVFETISPVSHSVLCDKKNSVFFDLNMECGITSLNRTEWTVHKTDLFEAFDEAGVKYPVL